MDDPLPLDGLDVLVLVDNTTDSLSTNPPGVEPEWRGLMARGRIQMLSGASICCAHHGLSLLLSARMGARTETLLFDTGAEGPTLLRNSAILGVDFSQVTNLVLSHGHWDHAGGMRAALAQIAKARGAQNVDCYVHPGMFAQRGMKLPSGLVFPMERVPSPDELAQAGARVIATREAQCLAGGAFYLSGEIPRTTAYEQGLPGQVRLAADGLTWEPDPWIVDERFVSVHLKGRGQFIFSACSHAGIVNVVRHAMALFPNVPVFGLMGGLHLSGSTESAIPATVADLQPLDLQFLAPGHCTGWRALGALEQAFGPRVVPLAVGKRFGF